MANPEWAVGVTQATRMRPLAGFTTRVFNPMTRLVAGRLPGFCLLTHTGRTSGRRYRAPLLVLQRGEHYVVGLWYGSDAQWVRNVMAAGHCQLRIRGHDVLVIEPELIVDPERKLMPGPLRLAGRIVRLTEFLRMRASAPGESAA